jgi:hypothetical protein
MFWRSRLSPPPPDAAALTEATSKLGAGASPAWPKAAEIAAAKVNVTNLYRI